MPTTLSFKSTITGSTLHLLDGTLTFTTNTPAAPTLTYTLTDGTGCPVSDITPGENSLSFKITYKGNLYTFTGAKSGSNYAGIVTGLAVAGEGRPDIETDNWIATATGTGVEELASKQSGS